MIRCAKCTRLMPADAAQCIHCGQPAMPQAPAQTPRKRADWRPVAAAVLTSKLFFLGSCTAGTFVGAQAVDSLDTGQHMAQGYAPDRRMSVIAVVPDPDKPGAKKTVSVLLDSLGDFQKRTPQYSFIPLAQTGAVEDFVADMHTRYTVSEAGPGRVIVETRFFHDVPPMGLSIQARYEATEKSVKPLYTRTGSDGLMGLVFGLLLAAALSIAGAVLKWRLAKRPQQP